MIAGAILVPPTSFVIGEKIGGRDGEGGYGGEGDGFLDRFLAASVRRGEAASPSSDIDETATAYIAATTTSPKVVSTTSPKAVSTTGTKAASAASDKAGSATGPKTDSTTIPRTDSATGPKADSAASPNADSAASPKADSAAGPNANSPARGVKRAVERKYGDNSAAKTEQGGEQDPAADPGNGGGPGTGPAAPENITVTISAVGDCTIGYDETFGYSNRFDQVYAASGHDPAYFFENVAGIFAEGDLTVANLENVFTDSGKKADKAYRFKGPPGYVTILEEGKIDVVNIANNHIYDYFQKGFDDTVATLKKSSVGYFGYDAYHIADVKGVKVGFAGFHIGGGGWSGKKKEVTKALETLRSEADIVVMSFHWGIEGHYKPTGDQRSLARYCVDNGADLVLGHHPHTLQSVEVYKGRTIAYSLGNFCFGGNRNPKDKDSIILRQSFEFDGLSMEMLEVPGPEIIPVSVSSVANRNDYKPTPVEGDAAARVMRKVSP